MNPLIQKKILLAVDGSDQALEAVRYISAMVAPERTQVVLFSVGTGFPSVFRAINMNPYYRFEKFKVMGWLADQQLVIGEFREKALKILTNAGFSKSAILMKSQPMMTGVLKDIVRESYLDYEALIVGGTGISLLKDLIFGSIAGRLAERIKHIPTIIVEGKPKSKKILVALDESIESMRGVAYVGALADGVDPDVTLCHCFSRNDRRSIPTDGSPPNNEQLRQYLENKFKPYMDEAARRLMDAGVSPERISQHYHYCKGGSIREIMNVASAGDFGAVVLGQRKAANYVKSYIYGRFNRKWFRPLKNMAFWVIN